MTCRPNESGRPILLRVLEPVRSVQTRGLRAGADLNKNERSGQIMRKRRFQNEY